MLFEIFINISSSKLPLIIQNTIAIDFGIIHCALALFAGRSIYLCVIYIRNKRKEREKHLKKKKEQQN